MLQKDLIYIKYGFVYITINKVNNKKYVGRCRYNSKTGNWKTYLGSGVYLKNAINKYGKENFYKIIIDEANNEEELRDIEEYYIDMFNAVDSKEFYNIKDSSVGGNTYPKDKNSKKYKQRVKRISEALLGDKNPMYNKPKTQKMIDAIKESNSLKVEVVDKDDNVLYFDSKTEMINYYIDVINNEVDYNKEEVTNLRRVVEHYLYCKENDFVHKILPKKKLRNIKDRIYEIKYIKVVK